VPVCIRNVSQMICSASGGLEKVPRGGKEGCQALPGQVIATAFGPHVVALSSLQSLGPVRQWHRS
jgi:hypothetical protein